MQTELMRSARDAHAQRPRPAQGIVIEAHSSEVRRGAQVKQLVDVHLYGEQDARPHEVAAHPLDRIDEPTVGLGDDAGHGLAEVDDREAVLGAPAPAASGALQLLDAVPGVAKQLAAGLGQRGAGDCVCDVAVHDGVPSNRRSTAASTRSYSPAVSKSSGRCPSNSRLRA